MRIIPRYKNIIWMYLIDSWIEWPTASIFSWIHWDEVSWIKVSKRLIKMFESSKLKLERWKLFLLVWANRRAMKLNRRYFERNMNRLFRKDIEPKTYEEKRARELSKVLDASDYLLDLHSTSWPSIPYMIAEHKFIDFVRNLWVPTIVTWWWELWSDSVAWDTETYINSVWWVGMTFESWSHKDRLWFSNSLKISLNFLLELKMISWLDKLLIPWDKLFVKMTKVHVCQKWPYKFKLQDLDNFRKVKKWELVWIDWDKLDYSDKDMILVMPNLANPKKWEDVYFEWEVFD